ncbi:PQQ-dependent sugar dehydrogenase [Halomicrobium salinisoli]|uniref:PQQ-dependent sugar dehydrogenase n=1 Tax=Halomicrobium salinisoli TaxID=2878391 RepID=UPI001CEFF633|nr:PQQ-dependent sugar dehydrogenase [Halomicrobium salinisoli]
MSDGSELGASRRRFLALASGAALAGCSSPGAPSSGSPSDGGTDGNQSTTSPTAGGAELLGYDVAVDHDETAWDGYDTEWSPPTDAPPTELSTERLVENLEVPWDLSFGTDGTLFITERVGRVLAFEDGEVRPIAEPDAAIDAGSVEAGAEENSWYVQGGEGGTLGVAAHPSYPEPPIVYVYYTYRTEDARFNRVAYVDASADDPADATGVLIDEIPADSYHNGGRLEFGPANYLWVTCGDSLEGSLAQDTSSPAGSILRVTPAGEPAPGNPDLGADADPRIFSYGHRNPQGVVWLPDGTPIATEHGPTGRDEVNRLVAGGNYGWPDVRQRDEYLDADDVRKPLVNTGESDNWAPSGAVFYTGDAVPGLRNRVLVGGLISQRLNVATVTPAGAEAPPVGDGVRYDQEWTDPDYVTTAHHRLADELGRIRHVEQGPDGALYAITSNRDGRAKGEFPTERDDVLVRISSAE